MAERLASRAQAFITSFDGERTPTKTLRLAKLRQRKKEPRASEFLHVVACALKSFANDLTSFFAWQPKSHPMCKNYGHVYDKSAWKNHGFRCADCGETIHSLDELRGSAAGAKRGGRDPRLVINW